MSDNQEFEQDGHGSVLVTLDEALAAAAAIGGTDGGSVAVLLHAIIAGDGDARVLIEPAPRPRSKWFTQYASLAEFEAAAELEAAQVEDPRLTEVLDRLPHEVRMGAEAAGQYQAYACGEMRPAPGAAPLGAPGDHLGGLPWATAMPLLPDAEYPLNLWAILDRRGRAVSAGVLNPPSAGGPW